MAAAYVFPSFFFLFFFSAAVVSTTPELITHLHFYLHERIFFSPNATVMLAVDANPNSIAPSFGDIAVFDSVLREGVDPNSVLLGRAQGLFIFSDMAGSRGRVLTLINFEFTAGEYNGSTLSLLGGLYEEGVTERSVIGGTGHFRLARGYALSEIINTTTTTYTVEFNIYVLTHQRRN
ncbi:dirigent protein 22-like [Curcuma longa]|uniref:dirigent protein 22-like n=1 Tax=Curcuma longa TaxID=136217 RepID=UPI003D9F64D9